MVGVADCTYSLCNIDSGGPGRIRRIENQGGWSECASPMLVRVGIARPNVKSSKAVKCL